MLRQPEGRVHKRPCALLSSLDGALSGWELLGQFNGIDMSNLSKLKSLLMGLVCFAISSPAVGHHSRSHFSRDWSELQGEIAEIHWVNPHIYFTLKTTGSDGQDRLIHMETGGPRYLERTGFYEDTLKVGDSIIAGGRLSMRSDTDFLLEQITFPNGEVLAVSRDDLEARFQDPTDRHRSREQGNLQSLEYSAQQRARNPYFT